MQRRTTQQSPRPANPFSRGGARLTYSADSRYGPQTVKHQSKRPGATAGFGCVGLIFIYFLISWMSAPSAPPSSVPVIPIAAKPTETTAPGLDKELTPPLSPEKDHLGYKPKLQENEEERIPYHRPDEGEDEGDRQRSSKHEDEDEPEGQEHHDEGQHPGDEEEENMDHRRVHKDEEEEENVHAEEEENMGHKRVDKDEDEDENVHATMATPLEADHSATGSDKKPSTEFGVVRTSENKQGVDADEDGDIDGSDESMKKAPIKSDGGVTSEGTLLDVKKHDAIASGSVDKSTSFTGTNHGLIGSEEDEDNHTVTVATERSSKDDIPGSTTIAEATNATESASETNHTKITKTLAPDLEEETPGLLIDEKEEATLQKSSGEIKQEKIPDLTSSTDALDQLVSVNATVAGGEKAHDEVQMEEEEDEPPELPEEEEDTIDGSDQTKEMKSSQGEATINSVAKDDDPAKKSEIVQGDSSTTKAANVTNLEEDNSESDQPELPVEEDGAISIDENNSTDSEGTASATKKRSKQLKDEEFNDPQLLRKEDSEDSHNGEILVKKERNVEGEDGVSELLRTPVEESEAIVEGKNNTDVQLTKAAGNLPEEDETPQLPDEDGDTPTVVKTDETDTLQGAKKNDNEASEQLNLPDDEKGSNMREDSTARAKEDSEDKLDEAEQDNSLHLSSEESNGIEREQKKASGDQESGKDEKILDENEDSRLSPFKGTSATIASGDSKEKTPSTADLVDEYNTTARSEVKNGSPGASPEEPNADETLVGDQQSVSESKISPKVNATTNAETKVFDKQSDEVADSEKVRDLNSTGRETASEKEDNQQPELPEKDDKESSPDQFAKDDEEGLTGSTQNATQVKEKGDSSRDDLGDVPEEADRSESHKITALNTGASSDSQSKREDHPTEGAHKEISKSAKETKGENTPELGAETGGKAADEFGLNKTLNNTMPKLNETDKMSKEEAEKDAVTELTAKEEDHGDTEDETAEVIKTADEGVAAQQLGQSSETTKNNESESSPMSGEDSAAKATTIAAEEEERDRNEENSSGMGEQNSSRLERKNINAEQSGNLRGSKTSNEELLGTVSSATKTAR